MDKKEYLLQCLSEECVEVSHRISKALRFTCEEVQPGGQFNNSERITGELVDLIAVMELLIADGVITDPRTEIAGIALKKRKIAKFMDYSEQVGVLHR